MARRRSFVLAVLATVVAAVAALAPAAFGTSSAKVTVTATDFKFRIVPPTFKAGRSTFTVVNRGEATHDFRIGGKKTRILNPGARQTITVNLKKGRYVAICTVPGHAQLGMRNTVVVR